MKINRYFPPCLSCLSHLLILECSYKSYLPLWPHLSFKFFFIQWRLLSSPHPRYAPDFASLWLHPGFPGLASFPSSWLSVCGHPQASLLSLNSSSSGSLMASSKLLWSAKLSADPFLLEDSFAPTCPVLPELRALNLWLFQLEPFNLTDAVQSCLHAYRVLSYYHFHLSVLMCWGHFWLFLLASSQPTLMWLQH